MHCSSHKIINLVHYLKPFTKNKRIVFYSFSEGRITKVEETSKECGIRISKIASTGKT
jgi:hypothetical protein